MDKSNSRAILIGNADYEYQEQVPAARNSLGRMRSVLTGELCGWPPTSVSVFSDEPSPGNLPDQLVTLFQDAIDIALFYYVGHGQIDPDGELCLSLTESQTELSARRRTTSLRFDQVRYALSMSNATTKIVILDCCFAGKAARQILRFDGVMDLTRVMRSAGTYTLAAAGEFEAAWFETSDTEAMPQTYFTKYLLDVIENGIVGAGPELRLDQIFIEASDALEMDNRPVPTSWSNGRAPHLNFARNASPDKLTFHGHRQPGLILIDAYQPVFALAFSPDNRYLATGSWRSVRLWDLTEEDYIWKRSIGKPRNFIEHVAFSLDGQSIAALGGDNTVRAWDMGRLRDEPSTSFAARRRFSTMAFRNDGRLIIVGRDSNSVWVQGATGDSQQHVTEIKHPSAMLTMALSADGSTLATGSTDGFVRIWSTSSLQQTAELHHTYEVSEVALSQDGQYLATQGPSMADLAWVTRIFRLPSLEEGPFFFHGPTGSKKMAFSADGSRIATVGVEETDSGVAVFTRIWDANSGRQLRKMPNSMLSTVLALNRDGSLLATSGLGMTVRLWAIPVDHEG